jgi:hypothetical protein
VTNVRRLVFAHIKVGGVFLGQKLMKYYDYAKEKGGLNLQMRLAIKTGLPSKNAATAPDTSENIQKFKQALMDLLNTSNVPEF